MSSSTGCWRAAAQRVASPDADGPYAFAIVNGMEIRLTSAGQVIGKAIPMPDGKGCTVPYPGLMTGVRSGKGSGGAGGRIDVAFTSDCTMYITQLVVDRDYERLKPLRGPLAMQAAPKAEGSSR